MPRSKRVYSHEFPYHITARSNNKEWFRLPMEEAWEIFYRTLNRARKKFDFQIHCFVLMSNHYHLMLTTKGPHNLGEVMCWSQKAISRIFNEKSNRINHLFGDRYHSSLVTKSDHYAWCLKYVYRNPVVAGIVRYVEDYEFSTFVRSHQIATDRPQNGLDSEVPKELFGFREWINRPHSTEQLKIIRAAVKRNVFKAVKRGSRYPIEFRDDAV